MCPRVIVSQDQSVPGLMYQMTTLWVRSDVPQGHCVPGPKCPIQDRSKWLLLVKFYYDSLSLSLSGVCVEVHSISFWQMYALSLFHYNSLLSSSRYIQYNKCIFFSLVDLIKSGDGHNTNSNEHLWRNGYEWFMNDSWILLMSFSWNVHDC